MTEKKEPLDVAQLAKRDLSEAAFPGRGKRDFRVFFDRAIHERIASHAAEKLALEICGVLVGRWHRDADGPFVLVDESIRCDKAVSEAGDVTFTHEAWNTEIYPQMDKKFTDRDIVGWYHSHPNFGIFLSERDCFIQDHFFNGPGQIAYVVDPVNGVEGVFALRDGKARIYPHFWVGDEIHLSSQGGARTPSSAPAAGQPPAAAPLSAALPPVSSAMTWLLGALCFLLLGYLVGGRLTDADRFRSEMGAVAHYGLFKCLKPGMREDLDQVNDNLQKITQAVDTLAKEHISTLAGDAKEEKTRKWSEIELGLLMTAKKVQEINNIYGLTPAETAEVHRLIDAREAEMENVRVESAKETAVRDSGKKATAAKSEGKPAAEPAKSSEGPLPVPAAPVKAGENKPAESAKPAETGRKP